MGAVWSGLSLLMMLAVAGGLIFLSRRTAPARRGYGPGGHGHRRHGGAAPRGARPGSYTTLGYAFSMTFGAALFLVTGLIGYRLDRHTRFKTGTPWAGEILWWQVLGGLAFACLSVWFWRKGLREIQSNVYVPELAGRDAAAPPSRRIERR